jgi:nucleoid DNA-binding protein
MDIHSKRIAEIIDRVSKKYKIDKRIVKEIVTNQFDFTKQTIKKVDSYNNFFPYVKLQFLCTFMVRKRRREFFVQKSKSIVEQCLSLDKAK